MRRVAFIALSAVVAIACHSDRGVPAGPSALIEDGNHDGNRFFYWLPPLLQQDAPTGQVFSKQVRPTITVTNLDRKSTRLNSSHSQISYAVFCLKKKKTRQPTPSS